MSQFMTDYSQIEVWLHKHKITRYSINPHGIVDVNDDVILAREDLVTIPVQFGQVAGTFDCMNNNLRSLVGCPWRIGNDFVCYGNIIYSISNIHKLVRFIGGRFLADASITHILGLMLIEGLRNVNIDQSGPIDKIINNHLQNNRDILACQEELIEAGFGAQAKL